MSLKENRVSLKENLIARNTKRKEDWVEEDQSYKKKSPAPVTRAQCRPTDCENEKDAFQSVTLYE
jgi:hypothetical protein